MKTAEFLKHVQETNEALLSAAFGSGDWHEPVAKIQQIVGSDHASIWIRTMDNSRLVHAMGMRVPQVTIEDFLGYGVERFDAMIPFRQFLQLVPDGDPYDTMDIMNHFNHGIHNEYQKTLERMCRQSIGIGRELSDGRLWDDALFRRSYYYNEWASKHGMDYTVGVKITIDHAYMADLALYRSRRCPVYEPRSKVFIEQITPCLKFALRSMKRARELLATQEALDRFSFGVLVLDVTGRVHFHNRIVSQILAEHKDHIRIRERCVRLLSNPKEDARLREFTHQLSGKTNSPVPHEFIIGDKTAPIRVVLVPLYEGLCERLWGHLYPAVIFLYQSASQRVEDLRRILKNKYGCSTAESNVGAMSACGMARDEVGPALNITEETVKSHLKSVFRKVKVGSQRELMIKIQSELLPFQRLGQ